MNGQVRAIPIIMLALLALGCVPEPAVKTARGDVPDASREIFVLNSLAESVTLIHPDQVALGAADSDCVYNDVILTGSSPNHISFSGGVLRVINSLDNTLSFLAENTLEELGSVHLERGSNPWQLIVDSAGTTGYIPCYVSGSVLRIDLSSASEGTNLIPDPQTIAEGLSLPEGGGFGRNSSGKELLFVTNSNNNANAIGRGTLTVIDTAAGSAVSVDLEEPGFDPETDRGCNPQAVIVFEDLGEAHVVCSGDHPGSGNDTNDGTVVVVSMDSLEVTARIAVGGSPNAFPAGIDSVGKRVFLPNNGYGITVYNYKTREILRGAENPISPAEGTSGNFFTGALYDPHTDLLFVSDFTRDAVHVIEGSGEYGYVRTLPGSDGPGYLLLVEE